MIFSAPKSIRFETHVCDYCKGFLPGIRSITSHRPARTRTLKFTSKTRSVLRIRLQYPPLSKKAAVIGKRKG